MGVAELEREGEVSVSWRLFEVEGVEIGPQAPELKEQARQLLTVADCWGHGWFKWDGCAAVNLQDLHTCCRIQWEASLDQIKELRGISQKLWDIPNEVED